MQKVFEQIKKRLEEELKLADEVKEKCARENPLMFDNAKGYSTGISNALHIVDKEASEYVGKTEKFGNSEQICEWRLCDEEANVYDTSCRNPHILLEGNPTDNKYEFCPYCGRNIKVVSND